MLLLIAFLCFVAAAIWAAILRNWPTTLLGVGLALWVLEQGDVLRVGG